MFPALWEKLPRLLAGEPGRAPAPMRRAARRRRRSHARGAGRGSVRRPRAPPGRCRCSTARTCRSPPPTCRDRGRRVPRRRRRLPSRQPAHPKPVLHPHPDPERFRAEWHADVGEPILAPVMMRNPVMRMTSRNIPDATNPDDITSRPRHRPTHVGYESAAALRPRRARRDNHRPRGQFPRPADRRTVPADHRAMKTFNHSLRPVRESRSAIPCCVAKAGGRAPRTGPPRHPACRPGPQTSGYPRQAFCLVDRCGETGLRRLRQPRADPQPTPDARPRHHHQPRPHRSASPKCSHPAAMLARAHGAHYTSELRLVAVDHTRRGHGSLRELS